MTRDAGRESSIRRVRAVLIATALMTAALPAAAQSADHAGKAPYDRNCGVCHGPGGSGHVAPPLVPLERTFDEVLAIVREGRGEMPPVSANAVNDDALRLIVDYLQAQQKKTALLTIPANRSLSERTLLPEPLEHLPQDLGRQGMRPVVLATGDVIRHAGGILPLLRSLVRDPAVLTRNSVQSSSPSSGHNGE
jgi:cytochrome c5